MIAAGWAFALVQIFAPEEGLSVQKREAASNNYNYREPSRVSPQKGDCEQLTICPKGLNAGLPQNERPFAQVTTSPVTRSCTLVTEVLKTDVVTTPTVQNCEP